MYSRIHIRIRHPVFAIRIVFITWCIRSSPNNYHQYSSHLMLVPWWNDSFSWRHWLLPQLLGKFEPVGTVVIVDVAVEPLRLTKTAYQQQHQLALMRLNTVVHWCHTLYPHGHRLKLVFMLADQSQCCDWLMWNIVASHMLILVVIIVDNKNDWLISYLVVSHMNIHTSMHWQIKVLPLFTHNMQECTYL